MCICTRHTFLILLRPSVHSLCLPNWTPLPPLWQTDSRKDLCGRSLIKAELAESFISQKILVHVQQDSHERMQMLLTEGLNLLKLSGKKPFMQCFKPEPFGFIYLIFFLKVSLQWFLLLYTWL